MCRSGPSVGSTAAMRAVMPQGRSTSSPSSDSSHPASSLPSPTAGRRVRRRENYVEVEVLADASNVAKEVTVLYDCMVDEVQAFSEKRYGGCQFALQVKELTLQMLKTTLTTRLEKLIDQMIYWHERGAVCGHCDVRFGPFKQRRSAGGAGGGVHCEGGEDGLP